MSRILQNINTREGRGVKIYSYHGRNNLSGERIREARVIERISQSDLAAKLQVEGVILERDSISRIENGSRFVADYELKAFAKALNVNIEWLLEETPQATK
jgi:transcriptional regulator with XRE-family HTH domain